MEDIERRNQKETKVHPKNKASWLSTLFFCWPFPIFIQGYKKDLNEEDLYGPLKVHESGPLGDHLKTAWEREKNTHQNPSLPRTIIKLFYKDILFYSFFLLIQELGIKMVQPLFVGKLMEYYTPDQTTVSLDQAYLYAFGIVLTILANVMVLHGSYFGLQHLSMKMQVACRSLIYQKALTLSKTALAESSIGQMVNLISNDVSRFDYICLHLYQLFVTPIQMVIVLYLLSASLDPSAMVGVGLLLAFIPLLLYMGKLTSRYRFRTAVKSDYRIRLMNEIISGIQVIKMYTWEKPFAKLVELARKLEIREIKANTLVRSFYMATNVYLVPIAIFLCVLTYVATGNRLQAPYVYVVTSFYGVLSPPLTFHLPRCIATLAEIKVSLKRIQIFLLNEEVQKNTSTLNSNDSKIVTLNSDDSVGILMEDVNVKWNKSSSDYSLNSMNMDVKSGQLVAVVGRVGSGKTTLIQSILQETLISSGTLEVRGTISYACQEPWLFSSSIRQNILFGHAMEWSKYKKVIKVCALEKDFQELPYGDRTIVGEKGVMLSGGQKARVSLARAIYKEADIYLLDDPLSAVDVKVGKHIFDECISSYLKNKCTVLVTHQIQYLQNVDRIYLLEDGKIVYTGTYSDLKNKEQGFIKFVCEAEKEEEEEDRKKSLKKQKSLDFSQNNNLPTEHKEQKSVGSVSKKVYLNYFRVGDCDEWG